VNPLGSRIIEQIADAILAGKRHPGIGAAMHFHLAGLRFPYTNMHYVLVAGGNAFYEKRSSGQASALAAIQRASKEANLQKPVELAPLAYTAAPAAASAGPR
jgi:spore germination cell wall hydrolase CwlJ-like protein